MSMNNAFNLIHGLLIGKMVLIAATPRIAMGNKKGNPYKLLSTELGLHEVTFRCY